MSDKFIKNTNLQNVVNKEVEIYKASLKNLRQPLKLLDSTTSFLLKSMRLALKMYKNSNKQLEKDFLTVFLNISNAALHFVRSSRIYLCYGYYGSIMVLSRALQNYLYTLMYIHHNPKDGEILIKEEKDTYQKDKGYRKKFHEVSLRKFLVKKGYDIPEAELQTLSKVTHGSTFSSQIFGYKPLYTEHEGEYEVKYAPEYDVVKAIPLIQLLMVFPLDFVRFFVMHFDDNTKKWKAMKSELQKHDQDIDTAITFLDRQYQFIRNSTPEELMDFISWRNKRNEINK